MSTILVVDDKEMMRDSVCETLRRAGFGVIASPDPTNAAELVRSKRPDLMVTDLRMPGMTGVELLERALEIDADLPVIVMTAFGTIETAVDAMKRGAYDYVTKPFEGDELIIAVKRGLRHAKLLRDNALLRATASPTSVTRPAAAGSEDGPRGLDRVIGSSPAMRKVKDQLEAIAGSHGTALITGESGAGKEVIARALHDLSPRSSEPFLAVNCAALSESLLESELFGHERGAFTGAERLRKGRFELAHGGTLLLDEVSEVSPQIQAKLLRALQERAFERVGSSVTIGVDVRVVATSNRDLPAEAANGSFRSDLFFRLNVLPIHLPPLRERREDVAELATHFITSICRRDGISTIDVEPAAFDLLRGYDWPGNVRELQNICERAVVLTTAAGESRLRRDRLEPWLSVGMAARPAAAAPSSGTHASPIMNGAAPSNGTANGFASGLRASHITEPKPAVAVSGSDGDVRPLADIERDVIVTTLQRFQGHRQKTARALGIGVRTLGLKLKKWKEEQLVPSTL